MSRIVQSLREVGEHFGKCTRTAQRWRRSGMPKTATGYDLEQCKTWLQARAYTGATFRDLEQQALVERLFGLAVEDLRRGLQHLCRAFILARGKSRQQLVNRAVRDILHGAMQQVSLLEGEGGEGRCSQKEGSR